MTPTAPTRVVLPRPSRHRSPGPRLGQTGDQEAVCPHLPASHSHLHPREHLSLKLETDNSRWVPLLSEPPASSGTQEARQRPLGASTLQL